MKKGVKNRGAFKKGRKGGPGRPKGVQNAVTREVKEMILNALAKAGGEAYLVRRAKKNPNAFLALLGKVLPLQVTGEGGGPLEVTHKVTTGA